MPPRFASRDRPAPCGRAAFALLGASVLAAGVQVAAADDDRPFWHPEAGSAAERFELAKRTEPELVAFLRRFPKGADLHNHAGGAVYSDYVIDEARAKGLRYDPASRGFTDSEDAHTVSLDQLEADAAMLKAFFETVSMRGWYPNTGDGHHHFFQTFSHLGSAERTQAAGARRDRSPQPLSERQLRRVDDGPGSSGDMGGVLRGRERARSPRPAR